MKENSCSKMCRFCRQGLLKIRFWCHGFGFPVRLQYPKNHVAMCTLPFYIPTRFKPAEALVFWMWIYVWIHFSVKNLAPVSVQDGYVIPWPANPTASGTSTTQLSRNKVRAGSELLDHWQTCWEQIHKANEKNIKKANRSENNLMLLHLVYDTRSSRQLRLPRYKF